ncbi:MAG TPA: UDP-glucose/GDP-mannose dehydrogenase family protein [Xanthobacteraceae bacterium]|nr:UDP-glucose/GDP-mannose dehydrogenase family protein [Xanthobacteraceae bacterium]
MRIAMIGTGYVGLVSGASFADFGHEVTCVDQDATKIAALGRGQIPIFEPGLAELVARTTGSGRLKFATAIAPAVADVEIVFIAVGTPSRRGDGHADLSYVEAAAREIARAVRRFTVIATKSTVPVGTGDNIEKIVRDTAPNAECAVVSNPEFLREGAAIEDFRKPHRVVIGADDGRARDVMAAAYAPLKLPAASLLFVSRRTAELVKYAANAFLATKVGFINEIADLCGVVGADVEEVARGIGLDPRIGAKFLQPGPGYGGSCLPKDAVALRKTAEAAGVNLSIVSAAVDSNAARKRALAGKVEAAAGGSLKGKRVAVLGLSFKANTDDMRESPALVLVPALVAAGAAVRAHDPAAMAAAKSLLPDIDYTADPYAAAEGADALVILTEWDAYRELDLARLRQLMKEPLVVDFRNLFPPHAMAERGFRYVSLGRPAA